VLITFLALGEWLAKGTPAPFDQEKTVVMAESGGFLTTGRPKSWQDCLTRQLRSGADICMTLDYPIKARRSGKGIEEQIYSLSEKEKETLLEWNIENVRQEVKWKGWFTSNYEIDFQLCAVIQGWDLKSTEVCAKEYAALDLDCFALGAVSTDASARARNLTTALNTVVRAREIIGKDRWLHLLGVTQFEFLWLVKPYITSFDSATSLIDPAFGNLMLPNGEHAGFHHGEFIDPRLVKYDIWKDGALNKPLMDLSPDDVDYHKAQEVYFKNYVSYLKQYFWSYSEGVQEVLA
jgi:hypothetical protein